MTLPTCTEPFTIQPKTQNPTCARILSLAREKLTGLPAELREKTIRQFVRLLRKRKPTPYRVWWDHAPRQNFLMFLSYERPLPAVSDGSMYSWATIRNKDMNRDLQCEETLNLCPTEKRAASGSRFAGDGEEAHE